MTLFGPKKTKQVVLDSSVPCITYTKVTSIETHPYNNQSGQVNEIWDNRYLCTVKDSLNYERLMTKNSTKTKDFTI
jgi:hypothetical protein